MYEEIDPSGDLLIIITPSTEPLAPWPCPNERLAIEDEENGDKLADKDQAMEVEGHGGEEERVSSVDESMPSDQPSETAEPTPSETEDLSASAEAEESQLSLKVSSKHLCLASRRFGRMLTGDWAEAHTVHEDGLRHVEIEGFDPEAYKIIMHAIHGNYRKVPRKVDDLDLLLQLALIVDDLDCHESIELLCDTWLEKWKAVEIHQVDRVLIIWIFISSVLRHEPIFVRATYQAIVSSPVPVPTLGLPIRDHVVSTFSRVSKPTLNAVLTFVQKRSITGEKLR